MSTLLRGEAPPGPVEVVVAAARSRTASVDRDGLDIDVEVLGVRKMGRVRIRAVACDILVRPGFADLLDTASCAAALSRKAASRGTYSRLTEQMDPDGRKVTVSVSNHDGKWLTHFCVHDGDGFGSGDVSMDERGMRALLERVRRAEADIVAHAEECML